VRIFPQTRAGNIRLAFLLVVLLIMFGRAYAWPFYWYLSYHPQEGDLIFQSLPKIDIVEAIEGVSGSPYSHCGVVVSRQGKWRVNEALVTVHDTPLFEWIARGRGARFCVYRLKPEFGVHIPALLKALEKYQGRPYDARYRLDDESIYCSELIFKAFKDASGIELGKLMKLGEMNWKPYAKTIMEFEGADPPLDRLMITPGHLAQAEQLVSVFTNGL